MVSDLGSANDHLEYQGIIRPLHIHTTLVHTYHTVTHTHKLSLDLSSTYPIGHTTLINAHTDFAFSFPQVVSRRYEMKEDGAEV